MRIFSRRQTTSSTAQNPLVPVLFSLSSQGKQALYAATNNGSLKRGTWKGCAFNAAGRVVGERITSSARAAQVFDTTPQVMSAFIAVWDGLRGSDHRCTALLREAILTVGLFTEPDGRVVRTDPHRTAIAEVGG
jgi:hypothetical protein